MELNPWNWNRQGLMVNWLVVPRCFDKATCFGVVMPSDKSILRDWKPLTCIILYDYCDYIPIKLPYVNLACGWGTLQISETKTQKFGPIMLSKWSFSLTALRVFNMLKPPQQLRHRAHLCCHGPGMMTTILRSYSKKLSAVGSTLRSSQMRAEVGGSPLALALKKGVKSLGIYRVL